MHDAPRLNGLDSDRAAIAWWLEAERLPVEAIADRLTERGSRLTPTDVDNLVRNPLFRAKARAEVHRALAQLADQAVERAQRELAVASPGLARELVALGYTATRADTPRIRAIASVLDRVPGLARITRTVGRTPTGALPVEVQHRAMLVAAEDDALNPPSAVLSLDEAIERTRALAAACEFSSGS